MTDTEAAYEQLTTGTDRRVPTGWITYPRFPDPDPRIPVGPTTFHAGDIMWPVARRRHPDGKRWQLGFSHITHPDPGSNFHPAFCRH